MVEEVKMETTQKKTRKAPRRWRVGDRIRFRFGASTLTGVIVEDRGPLAAGGQRLYSIRAMINYTESVFELSADKLMAY
jgi:hypothetical protein